MLWDLMFANSHFNVFMLLECYVSRKLVLEDVGLMTFFCYFGRFYVIGRF